MRSVGERDAVEGIELPYLIADQDPNLGEQKSVKTLDQFNNSSILFINIFFLEYYKLIKLKLLLPLK